MSFERIKDLSSKSVEALMKEGVFGFARKSKNYIKSHLSEKKSYSFKDVLFINGCTLPHPQRYRVDHQLEQLEANNVSADRVNYDKLTMDMVKYYRAFVFFRCPITPIVSEFITTAKKENKVVFFDIDDLVIDTKYTKNIKYLKTISETELNLYNDGVERMGSTLKMCDYAITTTNRLATELNSYVSDVYINRNVASERMVELSTEALKNTIKDNDKVVMSYLSGSITHNDDFKIIMPVIKKLMAEHSDLYLKVVGLLDIPEELSDYKERIIRVPFVSWTKLPKIISSIDINLVPLEKSAFNEAKSENKWIEAALCKVVTVASNYGAFKDSITDGVNGLLCNNEEEWYKKLSDVIVNKEHRNQMANDAHEYVIKNNVTTYTGFQFAKYITEKFKPNICFVLPSTNISGGVNVAIKHCNILKEAGNDVTIINKDKSNEDVINNDGRISIVSEHDTKFYARVDRMVATLWSTLEFVNGYSNVKKRLYLVQGFETDFSPYGNRLRTEANATYNSYIPLKYITISRWCKDWLKEKYQRDSEYAPNGIKLEQFPYGDRSFKGKIRILIEGNSDDNYKNVDESFKVVDKLDKNKYEIHYLSYQKEPKDWYYVNKFIQKVPHDKIGKVYADCDILIKSSILESFSYPPLEMMATGGISLVVPNDGNKEYLIDEYNCLLYDQGNIDMAVSQIERIVSDKKLREKLVKNGLKTAQERSWDKIEKEIIDLYE